MEDEMLEWPDGVMRKQPVTPDELREYLAMPRKYPTAADKRFLKITRRDPADCESHHIGEGGMPCMCMIDKDHSCPARDSFDLEKPDAE